MIKRRPDTADEQIDVDALPDCLKDHPLLKVRPGDSVRGTARGCFSGLLESGASWPINIVVSQSKRHHLAWSVRYSGKKVYCLGAFRCPEPKGCDVVGRVERKELTAILEPYLKKKRAGEKVPELLSSKVCPLHMRPLVYHDCDVAWEKSSTILPGGGQLSIFLSLIHI